MKVLGGRQACRYCRDLQLAELGGGQVAGGRAYSKLFLTECSSCWPLPSSDFPMQLHTFALTAFSRVLQVDSDQVGGSSPSPMFALRLSAPTLLLLGSGPPPAWLLHCELGCSHMFAAAAAACRKPAMCPPALHRHSPAASCIPSLQCNRPQRAVT